MAVALLVVVAGDSAARLARLQLEALPDFDYVGEVQRLRAEGRFGEAVMVADQGLTELSGEKLAVLASARQETLDAQSSWLRRLKDAGLGALSGQGKTIEGLAGAVTADLFIVGDVRDLVLQSGKLVVDGEADPVILSLSAIGLATTLAPEIDWAPSLLKAARKTGALSRKMCDSIVDLARSRKAGAAERLFTDVASIAERASPAGALRVLRHADDAKDLEKLALFVRGENAGAFILHVTGKEGAALIKATAKGGEAAAAAALKTAARKGPQGLTWLRGAGRAALKPHFVVGILKGVYKGNAQALATRIAESVDPHGWWIVPALAAWVLLESCGLLARFLPRKWQQAAPAGAAPAEAALA